MFVWVCLFITIFTVQNNLGAMTADGADEEAKDVATKKYTFELCTPSSAGSGDRARIAALAAQARAEVETKVVAGTGKDDEGDDDEKEERAAAAQLATQLHALVAAIMKENQIVVARYETNIVGYLVFARKVLSEQFAVVAVSQKMRKLEYYTIAEICVDKEHQKDSLDRKLSEAFVRQFAPTLTPRPVDIYWAAPEVGGVSLSRSSNWRRSVALELVRRDPEAYHAVRDSYSRGSARGGRGGCCLFDCD